ncbi:MAG: tRNA (N6-threonylcarbamoyladenosine(37)-N6)-methyltransferase TrmO [Desulfobacteraceae bacterium]|nr:tRNA (N6-threonylcarbamoyladenosine(37)-N6)-methyltransferase TrmO [Desulfobacteraceae bacterium]MCB9494522.1 tRNA (N6-threonylcarbamoyladenosine(37)-N6)-methyltransferase TrmO [Desulfobacteraceae bacterium]
MDKFTISPVGEIISPFKTKFGLPRQSGIISSVESKICLFEEFSDKDFFRGIENFSHLWILFIFHHNISSGFNKLVRPPRLGGNKKIGVFSSRSPFRPNFTGMSAVELVGVEFGKNTVLTVRGGDFADKTPVIDIKPYIKYADSIEKSECKNFGSKPEKKFEIKFSLQAEDFLKDNEILKESINEILSYDPRPSYLENNCSKSFGMEFDNVDIRFEVKGKVLYIKEIVKSLGGSDGSTWY